MPLEAIPVPAPAPRPAGRRPRRVPFWRGAAGAVALALWSVAGVLGAALALIPVALQDGPRGRAPRAARAPEHRRLVAGAPAGLPAAEPLPQARAAGEAYPG